MSIPRQRLLGQLLPADLRRFQHYSQLIFDLQVEKYRPGVDSYVLLSLSKALAGQPLLPRLQKLRWSQSHLSDHDILHFISPSLHYLIFNYDGYATSIVSADSGTECLFLLDTLLQQVAAAAPSLRRLCLAAHETMPCAFVPFSVCRSLRQVDISARTLVGRCTYLSALTSLQNLTTLALSGLYTLEDDDVKALQGFSTLEQIILEGDCASLGSVLLHVGRSPSTIQKVGISVIGYNTEKQAALMAIIVSQFSASLEDLRLNTLIDEDIPLHNTIPLPMTVIRPLLSMGQLCNVYWAGGFVPPSSAGWSNEDFCAMASAWPKLISLVILWDSWPQTRAVPSPTVTLECLPHIARACPCLRMLRITTLKWTWAADLDAYPIMSHRLERLDTDIYTTEDNSAPGRTVADTALFLDRLFPYLDARDNELAPQPQMSKDIFKHICTLQAARLQERRRITSEKR
ncbi:uncharacterized protein B0H18DRAFT_432041 [Fomitopsis serialis]|uniref:uncharacterized protein n=1 Tax=Fomitopsis serialis TaxID=139415 RepID=UPI002007FE25|nr:uncharacterized protein B0H18DRAFT_432041 [Neoantrodia serialis]KAH9924436.1 hypothetical protein B0H18DRAFT_432041 [Neoantrodia serialis]